MTIRSESEIRAALAAYYQAQVLCADGKSFTMATENGTRVLTNQDLPDINMQIRLLERQLSNTAGTTHNVAVANFNHDKR